MVGPEALNFLQDLGKWLRRATGEAKSRHYLLQRLSVAVQRGNAVAVLASIGGSVTLREGEVFKFFIVLCVVVCFLYHIYRSIPGKRPWALNPSKLN